MLNNIMLPLFSEIQNTKEYLLIFIVHLNRRQRLLLHSCLINGDFSQGLGIISWDSVFDCDIFLFCF